MLYICIDMATVGVKGLTIGLRLSSYCRRVVRIIRWASR